MKVFSKSKQLIAALGLIAPILTHAQALNLADEPLFIQSAVQPNILFLMDDSGSMDWETTVNNYDTSLTSEPYASFPDPGDVTQRTLQNPPTLDSQALDLCPGFNVMTYNPERTYSPWQGVDSAGNEFADMTNLNAVRSDPYVTSGTNNISDHVYFLWNDADNDGQYDDGECPDVLPDGAVEVTESCRNFCEERHHRNRRIDRCIYDDRDGVGCSAPDDMVTYTTTGGTFSDATCRADDLCVVVADLLPGSGQALAGEMHGSDGNEQLAYINYANWYTYYRKRAYVAQKTMTELVAQSDARLGLGLINNNYSRAVPVRDMREETSKNTLLRQIARIHPNSGTSLRRALHRAGEYFENGSNSLFPGVSLSSPILSESEGGACQQNFTVLLSDGYANGSTPSASLPNGGDTDSDTDTVFSGGIYADGPATGSSYDTRTTYLLADFAMHYFERDLAPGLPNLVPENAERRIDNLDGTDDNMHQNMITYTVAYGINGEMSCSPGIDDGCTEQWPGRIRYNYPTHDVRTVDDMRHAAANGRGKFLSANNPDTLISSLESALRDIEAVNSSSAAVAANSTTLNTETVVYQARFNTGDWHGDLIATPISSGTDDTRDACAGIPLGGICTENLWNAGTGEITDGINDISPDDRVVFTFSSTKNDGVNFAWPVDHESPVLGSELDSDFIDALLANATGDEDEYGQAVVNYLKGDQTNEVAEDGSFSSDFGFRRRATSVLGDIINSEPRYMASPSAGFPDDIESVAYSNFETEHAGRRPLVYVGANDGMLHAFNADDGTIVFSYIPKQSHENIGNLADTAYSHKFFVDNAPTVGDAFFSDGAWHTILLGSHRAGGRGIFALDVTDPDNFTNRTSKDYPAQVVLWELEHANLGYTFAQPDLVKLNNGVWAAIFGNGYNSTGSGQASLFIVNAETGALIANIETGISSTNPNGLATTVPVDINGDYMVDYVYAGDLDGGLYRFDLRTNDPMAWNATQLFQANTGQAITSRPSVAYHPEEDGIMIYFGTGRYIDESDNVITGAVTQSFYGVWDDFSGLASTYTRANLVGRQIESEFWVDSDADGTGADDLDNDLRDVQLRFSTGPEDTGWVDIDWGAPLNHKGWYLDLTDSSGDNRGERQITNSVVRGSRIVFTTTIPNDAACDFGGTGFLMELDAATGGPLDQPPLDFNNDGVINADDLSFGGTTYGVPSGQGMVGLPTSPTVIGTTTAGIEVKAVANSRSNLETFIESTDPGQATTRTSWSEFSLF